MRRKRTTAKSKDLKNKELSSTIGISTPLYMQLFLSQNFPKQTFSWTVMWILLKVSMIEAKIPWNDNWYSNSYIGRIFTS
jgi:hypothetical protein